MDFGTFVFLFCSFCIGYLVYYLLVKKKTKSAIEEVTDPTTGKRRIRIYDGYFKRGIQDNLYTLGEAFVSNIVFIESIIALQTPDLVKALVSLAKIHPLLRMKFEWEGDCQRFFTEMNQFSEEELLYSEEDSDDWVDRFEQELQHGYDAARGPLWRVVRIKECFDANSKKYTSTLLFSFHHSISDGISMMNFLDQLLEILDQIHCNNFKEEHLKPLPLLPPLPELIQHHTYLSWWERIVLRLNKTLQSFKGSQHRFLDIFPPPLVQNPNMVAKTCIIPGSLTEAQTALLIRNCKTNKCTVTGALALCYAIAIGKMIAKFDERSLEITFGLPVNVRKGCKPVVNDNNFGLYIGFVFISLTYHNNFCKKQYFWDQARQISSEIREQLNAKKQYGFFTELKYGLLERVQNVYEAKKTCKYAGRFHFYGLSNRGNFVCNKQRANMLKGVHSAVSENIVGLQMSVSAVTVSRQLYWSVIYCNRAIHEKQARTCMQLFLESMIELSCQDEDK